MFVAKKRLYDAIPVFVMVTKKPIRNFKQAVMQEHPFIFSDRPRHRLQRHLAFWAFWWLFLAILYSFPPASGGDDYWNSLKLAVIESFIFMFAHAFLAYSLMYFIIPRFLLRQRYWATAVWTILFFIATACWSIFLGRFIINPVGPYLVEKGFISTFAPRHHAALFLSLMAGLRGGITIGGIAAAIKLMKFWYVKEQRNLQLQKENVESQLQLLKAQVHPHFLFNTLNNIYSHTQDKAPVAAQLITGLSEMLRFILYESSQPLVPLSKELQLMQEYISLEQIRYGNKLDLHIDLPTDTGDLHIAPLLMLPLIENCFKHGASTMLEQPWISLQVTLQDKQLHMKLLNGKTNEANKAGLPSGIGIQNVRKRLTLIYPGKHELSVTNEEDVFIVNLKLELERVPARRMKLVNQTEPVHA